MSGKTIFILLEEKFATSTGLLLQWANTSEKSKLLHFPKEVDKFAVQNKDDIMYIQWTLSENVVSVEIERIMVRMKQLIIVEMMFIGTK